MEIVNLDGGLGVELRDVDLREPLTAEEQDRFRNAFVNDLLVLVRGQELDGEHHDRFLRYLGPLQQFGHGGYFEYISNVQEDNPNMAGVGRLLFHNDGAFRPDLRVATSLYAINVSPTSPPTGFASGVGAYEALPDDLRDEVEKLNAVHMLDLDTKQEYRRTRAAALPPGHDMDDYQHATHPVVVTVPHGEKKALFVSEFYTSHIEEFGADSADGEALLQKLFSYLYSDANTYFHHYTNGDLVVWNNIGLQHARVGAIDTNPRHLRRVVVSSLDW